MRTKRSKAIPSLLLLAALTAAIAGCAQTTVGAPTPSESPVTEAPEPSPTATAAERTVAISVDGIAIDGGELLAHDEPEKTLAALEQLLGARPEPRMPDPAYDIAVYDWMAVSASVVSGADISLRFETPDVPGLEFVLAGGNGIGLGSTREEVLAAGGEDVWDEDGDGVADYLSIDRQEVPGTQSLSRPGEVGVKFIELKLTDGIVTRLSNGANDFSDL